MCQPIFLPVSQLDPHMRRILPFTTTKEANCEDLRNQYIYRLMAFVKGSATLVLGDESVVMSPGSLLFLCPGQPYRVLNTHGDFEVINLHFDMTGNVMDKPGHPTTLLDKHFRAENIVQLCRFTDCEPLNRSGYVHSFTEGICHIRSILDESLANQPLQWQRSNTLLRDLLILYVRQQLPPAHHAKRQQDINEILLYIRQHYTERLDAKTLAGIFFYHPNHLNTLVRKATGVSLHQYIQQIKLEAARQLLYETDMTISAIAQYLSFHDASHLSKTFHQQYGISPSKIRENPCKKQRKQEKEQL